ncbi:SMR family transporter [Gordonia sp. LSe1-13]|uniref:SMR family transporter n=1 Tax=Gordonia sesuvii TaxID=3116777 RepID=A0ABU7MA40_9ACTN|nr:SMR family transporter [Gordonia sp. LSe1-13]
MTAWIFLTFAILSEVSATMSLRAAVSGSRRWYIVVAIGYVVSFVLLSGALANGMPLGVAYGIWSAVGVALIAVLGKVIFREPLTVVMSFGIVLIVGGVLLVETGSAH